MFEIFVRVWNYIQLLTLKNDYEELLDKYKEELQGLGYTITSNLEIS
jgi:hypothetical protein